MTWPPELLESSIGSYISTNVPTVQEGASAAEATRLMDNPYGVVFVTDGENRLKGLITRNDLTKLGQVTPPRTASDLGTMQKVVAISSGAQLWQLLKIMNGENKASKTLDVLPVVDSEKKPVGVIRRETLRESLPQKIASFQRLVMS